MNIKKPKLIVFASGSEKGGGSGFENLVKATTTSGLDAEIVAVVSNHAKGGVFERAQTLKIPFEYLTGPWEASRYQFFVRRYGADFVALSGWLKLVKGLDPEKTFNIHPGPLPEFGGPGLYGHHVHEAVLAAYKEGTLKHSEITMHFVTEEYDRGPVFFRIRVPITPHDRADDLGHRANKAEHAWQPDITNMVVHGKITWDGKNPHSLVVPKDYTYHLPLH